MRTKVRVEDQVETFVKSLAPEPRRTVRQAIKGLAEDRGDTKPLEGKLSQFHRQRVGHYRVLYPERFEKRTRVIECVFARERLVVYEMFLRLQAEELVRWPREKK